MQMFKSVSEHPEPENLSESLSVKAVKKTFSTLQEQLDDQRKQDAIDFSAAGWWHVYTVQQYLQTCGCLCWLKSSSFLMK